MRKNIVKLMTIFVLLGSVFGGFTGQVAAQEKINVVTTTTHLTDLVEDIGGERVEVTGLMGPGVDPHGYNPSPSDIEALTSADMIGHNGLNLEAMFTDLFEAMESAGSNIFALEEVVSEDDVLEYEYEGKELENDPHIWFDIDIWKNAAQLVADELTAVDEEGADYYQTNLDEYITQLDELDAYIKERVEEVPEESRYLITAHDAFGYFGARYGFEVVGIQGLNSQTEAGTGDIAAVADLVVENNIKAAYIESSVPDRNMQALVEAVEADGGTLEIGGVLFSDALGTDEENAGNYFDAYRTNIDTIVDGLK